MQRTFRITYASRHGVFVTTFLVSPRSVLVFDNVSVHLGVDEVYFQIQERCRRILGKWHKNKNIVYIYGIIAMDLKLEFIFRCC
jgi:hypothetical protein